MQFPAVIVALALSVLLSGCAGMLKAQQQKEVEQAPPLPTLHQYMGQLAAALGEHSRPLKPGATVAVTSFYLADQLGNAVASNQGSGLSTQVQESLISYVTQMGLEVVEFRLQRTLTLAGSADNLLSRDIALLRERHKFDLALTGTISESHDHYTINARLITMLDSRTASAATISVPKAVLWGNEKAQMRDGKLHRGQY
ncbi:hypothetical protein C3B51_13100 [Pseudoalteromonas rubra]|uniref:FlgO domain-containing protein n=1 Tax=Pseudoalteromonas rubra TaxID=43658 RepID=A0A4Q7EC51_9GAMM|nr:FlgO family outer membrane protein [Pseudoalteromonas rubra]RZM80110.1 hypothetical protein C3B51_13100 [Pseudoalteromonas rubra]